MTPEAEQQDVAALGRARSAGPPPISGNQAGKVLVLAWIVSIGVHGLLFWIMFAFPWFVRREKFHGDMPVALTDLLGGSSRVKTTVTAREPRFEAAALTDPTPLRYTPRQSDVSAALAEASGLDGGGGGSDGVLGAGSGPGSGPGQRDGLGIIGLGGGGGGDLGKYGLDLGSTDPGPTFFGLGGRARGAKRIVYVVDRSGSMTETFDAVRKELNQSVARLRRSQRFHVVLFNDGAPQENPPKKLVNASNDQKEALEGFLARVEPGGNTDPIPAMRRAFELGPDLIYFLTDGEFDPRLVEELRRRNAQKKIRIFTIAYVSQMGSALLEQIARENYGEFRFISEHDL